MIPAARTDGFLTSPPETAPADRRPLPLAGTGRFALLAVLGLLAACAPPPPKQEGRLVLTAVDFAALPDWSRDRQAEAVPALLRSCDRIARLPDGRPIGRAGIGGIAADWRAPCAALARLSPGDDAGARRALERWFVPHRATDGTADRGRFTGYFEMELDGSPVRRGFFRTPVYGPPTRRPGARASRAEIERLGDAWRAKSGAPVLFWARDPVEVFFLQVQGSGRVRLPDGRILRVGYAGDNGHDFVAIGRLLADRGVLGRGKVTMTSIRDWLRANPARGLELMAENPRYVFFRVVNGVAPGDGPIGAQGVPLTARRSLAVDESFIPLGVPVWLDTVWPGRTRPLRRLMVAQDKGNAIKGPVRGDVFWGTGQQALRFADGMNEPGGYYVLLPRPAADSS